jgi:urea transport system permease protein
MTGGFDVLGGFSVTWNRLYIIVFCFVVLGGLALILNRTSFGLHMRAVTQNRDMAAVMGIRTARIDALTFGLGSGIAGMAGVALSQIGNVSPNLGTIYIVDSFLVVVLAAIILFIQWRPRGLFALKGRTADAEG